LNGIYFPGLGINFGDVGSEITVFGFSIKFYGIIIAIGFIGGYYIALREARRTGQDEESYYDLLIRLIVFGVIGARLYYVIFNHEEYFGQGFKDTLISIINIRKGGLAIYGGVIAGVITIYAYAKRHGLSARLMLDTIAMSVPFGQLLGRWGNFFNREAFGDYTDSVLRMAIPVSYYENKGTLSYLESSGIITDTMLSNQEVVNGVSCITVHPTFLYESLWNVVVLIGIFLYRKHKRFDGELILMYMMGYGLGRFWIEGLRADSLMIGSLRVSQVLAACIVVISLALGIYMRRKCNPDTENSQNEHIITEKAKKIKRIGRL